MRKLTFILLACVLCPSLAGAWGFLHGCITTHDSKGPCLGETFFTAGEKPCINVIVEDTKKSHRCEGDKQIVRDDLQKYFQKAFDSWINAVRDTIKVPGRKTEFNDFLQSFPTALEVHVTDADSTDKTCMNVKVIVGAERGAEAEVCATAEAGTNQINWYTYNQSHHSGQGAYAQTWNACHMEPPSVLSHEIGHLFGLIDLYGDALSEKASNDQLVNAFSLLRMGLESSTMQQYSIMDVQKKSNNSIGCDDVDAIINMADLIAVKRGTVSARVKNGWASFCRDDKYPSFRYAYGQPYRTAAELAENKERIDAILFFEQNPKEAWQKESENLDKAINDLETSLKKRAEENEKSLFDPAFLADLAKLNYLRTRQQEVDKMREGLGMPYKQSLLTQYRIMSTELSKYASIAPGTSWYEGAGKEKLEKSKPSEMDLEIYVSLAPHKCMLCNKVDHESDRLSVWVDKKEELVFVHPSCYAKLPDQSKGKGKKLDPDKVRSYLETYRYQRNIEAALELTYAQLEEAKVSQDAISLAMANADVWTPLRTPTVSGAAGAAPLADNTRVGKPAANTSAHSATASTAGTSATGAGTTTLVPTSADQFSETALAGRPRAKVDPIPTPPAGSATATAGSAQPQPAAPPAELVCSVCGQKIANEADAYIPPERGRGPVHKHSECAFKYFSRFYSVDNTSLEQYNKSYLFGGEPRDVTAAKGLMKKLGLTPAEVKEYALAARAAYRAEADRYTQQQQADAAAREQRQRDLQTCANYVVVTADDIARFESANRGVLDAIAKRERERKNLTDKQKHVKRRLAQMKANQALTDYCQKIK